MSEREEIKVLWEGPFSIEQITGKETLDPKKYDVRTTDIGLYQIYGSHPLYGDNVLVYIGRTKGKKGFSSRLKNRWVIEGGSDSENVEIYLGTLFSDSKKLEKKEILEKELIDKVEVLLINAHKPAYNSSNIQSVYDDFRNARYLVHNTGNYRRLSAVLDSKYLWEDYVNYKIVDMVSSKLELKIDEEDEYYGIELNNLPKMSDKYTIWFGIDDEIWTNKKVPLMFQVYSDNEKVMKKIEDADIYELYKYTTFDEIPNCFYIDTLDFNLDSDDLIDKFKAQVINIKTTIDNIVK